MLAHTLFFVSLPFVAVFAGFVIGFLGLGAGMVLVPSLSVLLLFEYLLQTALSQFACLFTTDCTLKSAFCSAASVECPHNDVAEAVQHGLAP